MSVAAISPSLLQAIARGSILLTAGPRPARALRLAYDLHMRAAGHTLWPSPPIFALETWLASLWQQLLLSGRRTALLLNHTQQHLLWRDIIAADADKDPAAEKTAAQAPNPDALAALALDAWSTLCLHNGHARLDEAGASPESRAFVRWARAFDRICTRRDYLVPAQLPAALATALAEGTLPVPSAGLTLVDLDALRPAHQSLLDAITSAGYPAEHRATTLAAVPTLFAAPDTSGELRAVATWARRLLDQGASTRMVVVAPSLADRRPAIERALASHLPAASFEFSLGTPLDRTPPVLAALDLLRWPTEPLPVDRVRSLLLSPFFGATTPAESLASAAFDAAELKTTQGLRPQHTLTFITEKARTSPARHLYPRLRALQHTADTLAASPRSTYAHWTHAFRGLLDACGWTRATDAGSLSLQIHRRWESVLDEVATLDFEATPVSSAAALEAVARTARAAIFAPQPDPRFASPLIQVLSPHELGGVPCDALWFLSADDASWPPAATLNPLLARTLQRRLKIPGADPTHDAAAAAALTRRIAASAPHAIFSYVIRTEDGERRPSSLVRHFPIASLDHPAPPATLPYHVFADDLPLPPLPPGTLAGGATILELQAACPFRAFAERRLFSAEPEFPEPGLDPRDRGSLAHKVMQLFWESVQTQANLRALTPPERNRLLAGHIAQALEVHVTQRITPWDTEYLAIQQRRLAAVLDSWLDKELARPDFTVVASEHEVKAVPIGPLHLDLRVDRIDQTPSGTLIIDYKTGSAHPREWTTSRPEKPQLPLYAIADPQQPPGGIAFATLRPGKDLKLSRSDARNFPAQLAEWQNTLTVLAEDFARGDVRVDPRYYPQTCKHCGQRTLCRIDPYKVEDQSDEDDIYLEAEVADA